MNMIQLWNNFLFVLILFLRNRPIIGGILSVEKVKFEKTSTEQLNIITSSIIFLCIAGLQ